MRTARAARRAAAIRHRRALRATHRPARARPGRSRARRFHRGADGLAGGGHRRRDEDRDAWCRSAPRELRGCQHRRRRRRLRFRRIADTHRRCAGGRSAPDARVAGDHGVRGQLRPMTGATDTMSRQIMARARELFPGGVSSPVRAFGGVGGEPFVVERGEGSRIWDVDGNEYIDFVLSWGPLVLGHAAPVVLDALEETMRRGTSFGIPTELEVRLAERITERMPHLEMLRFVSSGTEATMSAIRVARAATDRDVIVKFDGCYHGHADSFLVRAGSGVATLGLPNSPGVPEALARLTITAPFNDLGAVERALTEHEVAAVIVEPIVGNAGFIAPGPQFLPGLRRLATEHGALLIFDEVMTGFRIAYGGARERFGVVPDLTTLGKVIGGGLPVAAYGGRRDLMESVAPTGPVYQAGTLSGNPLAMR